MTNEKDMIKWLNNLKSDIGQQQHSQLWCYVEILDVIAKYLESTERTGKWINREKCQVDEDAYEVATCSECGAEITIEYPHDSYCPNCGARMNGESK